MIHDKLRKLRKQSGKRLQDVAKATNLSISYLSQIETGKIEPSIAHLRQLAAYYNVGIVSFFTSEEEENIIRLLKKVKSFCRKKEKYGCLLKR